MSNMGSDWEAEVQEAEVGWEDPCRGRLPAEASGGGSGSTGAHRCVGVGWDSPHGLRRGAIFWLCAAAQKAGRHRGLGRESQPAGPASQEEATKREKGLSTYEQLTD